MKPFTQSIKKITCHGILLVFFGMAPLALSGQEAYPSIGIKTCVSGSGLAIAPAIIAGYNFRHLAVNVGVNMQVRKTHICGVQGTVSYYLGNPGEKIRLGFFTHARYFYSAGLKQAAIAQEKYKAPESSLDFDRLILQTVEGQVGFGLLIGHSTCISTFYGIGIGAYQTLGNTQKYSQMHREINRAQLMLTFGFNYALIRNPTS